MEGAELYSQERSSLRKELMFLKDCQVGFINRSLLWTGVILGLATAFAKEPYQGIVFLLPLIVILPSWWIFVDKATTITRIVGYIRILEKILLDQFETDKFMGWENALGTFRKKQSSGKLKTLSGKQGGNSWLSYLMSMLFLRTTHRYWVISNYTFMALSGLCLLASTLLLQGSWLLALPIPAILFLLSSYWNTRMVWRLLYGRHSYDSNERYWTHILTVERSD